MQHNKTEIKLVAPLLIAACVFASPAYALSLVYDLGVDLTHDDNVSRAELGSDIESDTIFSLEGGATYVWQLNDISGLSFRAHGEGNFHSDFDDISNYGAGLTIGYNLKPGSAYNALRYRISGDFTELWFDDSDIRDGRKYNLTFSLAQRSTDRLQWRAGARYDTRHGGNNGLVFVPTEDSEVFDLESTTLFANVDFSINDPAVLYATALFRDGDIVSTAIPTVAIVTAASREQFAPDPVFAPGGVAYRLAAETIQFSMGLNYAINRVMAFDVSGRYYDIDADLQGISYDGFIVTAGLLFQFK